MLVRKILLKLFLIIACYMLSYQFIATHELFYGFLAILDILMLIYFKPDEIKVRQTWN